MIKLTFIIKTLNQQEHTLITNSQPAGNRLELIQPYRAAMDFKKLNS